MNRIVLMIIGWFLLHSADAQIYVLKDHRPQKPKEIRCDTVPELADSMFSALKKDDFDSIKIYLPDKEYLKASIDSLNPDMTSTMQDVRYQYLMGNMRARFKKFQKEMKKQRLRWKGVVLADREIEYGVHEDGHHYAYVTLKCIRKKKIFSVSFLAIKLRDKWFLGDELRLGEPKKMDRFDLKKYEKYIPDMGG